MKGEKDKRKERKLKELARALAKAVKNLPPKQKQISGGILEMGSSECCNAPLEPKESETGLTALICSKCGNMSKRQTF